MNERAKLDKAKLDMNFGALAKALRNKIDPAPDGVAVWDWANLVNCTPHPICWRNDDGEIIAEFAPSGFLARVSVVEQEAESRFPFPVVRSCLGEVEGIPENDDGERVFVVSRMVFDATDRTDVIAPDTGKTAVRDENGRIIGVRRFIVK